MTGKFGGGPPTTTAGPVDISGFSKGTMLPGTAQSVEVSRDPISAGKRQVKNNGTNVSFFDPGNFNNNQSLPACNVHIDNRQYNITTNNPNG